MFGNDDQQTQASGLNTNGGFSPSNFTPPAAMTSAPVGTPGTLQPAMPPVPQSHDLSVATSAPSIPANPLDTPELPANGTPDPTPLDDSVADVASDELLGIKQQALQQLSPLVNQLDQTPEEKFRTTMMMIQASDDQTLLKSAYDAAQAITDEKQRAQALLDVINEINYFTQHGN